MCLFYLFFFHVVLSLDAQLTPDDEMSSCLDAESLSLTCMHNALNHSVDTVEDLFLDHASETGMTALSKAMESIYSEQIQDLQASIHTDPEASRLYENIQQELSSPDVLARVLGGGLSVQDIAPDQLQINLDKELTRLDGPLHSFMQKAAELAEGLAFSDAQIFKKIWVRVKSFFVGLGIKFVHGVTALKEMSRPRYVGFGMSWLMHFELADLWLDVQARVSGLVAKKEQDHAVGAMNQLRVVTRIQFGFGNEYLKSWLSWKHDDRSRRFGFGMFGSNGVDSPNAGSGNSLLAIPSMGTKQKDEVMPKMIQSSDFLEASTTSDVTEDTITARRKQRHLQRHRERGMRKLRAKGREGLRVMRSNLTKDETEGLRVMRSNLTKDETKGLRVMRSNLTKDETVWSPAAPITKLRHRIFLQLKWRVMTDNLHQKLKVAMGGVEKLQLRFDWGVNFFDYGAYSLHTEVRGIFESKREVQFAPFTILEYPLTAYKDGITVGGAGYETWMPVTTTDRRVYGKTYTDWAKKLGLSFIGGWGGKWGGTVTEVKQDTATDTAIEPAPELAEPAPEPP